MTISIKNRYTKETLYECEADSLKGAVEKAVLEKADLSYADLSYADLCHANLRYTNLSDADLRDANLRDADLRHANLGAGVNREGYRFTLPPIQISDEYAILIWEGYMEIGCEKHTLKEWAEFTQKRIIEMDGKKALAWWKKWKKPLLAIAEANDRMKLAPLWEDKEAA